EHPLAPPATIVIGKVAGLDLGWFERRPLFGRRVVVTRAAEQAGPLVDALRRRGAEPLVVPTIAIADPADGGASLQEAVAGVTAGRYAWVVLTSANGAERFLGALPDARALGGVQVAAIGPATAEAVRRFSI